MTSVSVTEGIVYGYKIMGYFIGVIIVGQLISFVGFTLIERGTDVGIGADPNWFLVFVGIIFLIFGILTVFAGSFGALYKLIADGVAKGREMAPS